MIVYTPFFKSDSPLSKQIPESQIDTKLQISYPKEEFQITGYKPMFQFEELPSNVKIDTNGIDIGNMQDLIDKFAESGINIKVTSGFRPGAKTKQGNDSWHGKGFAIDIVPGKGENWDSITQKLKGNKDLLNWMKENNYGILDETNPQILSKTGGTGAHWHIGKDRVAQQGLLAFMQKGGILGFIKDYNINKYPFSPKNRKDWDNYDNSDFKDFNEQIVSMMLHPNYKKIYDYIIKFPSKNPISKELTSALLANMWQESKFDPFIKSKKNKDGKQFHGLFQLSDSLWENYESYLDKYDKEDDLLTQLDYILPVITNTENKDPHNIGGNIFINEWGGYGIQDKFFEDISSMNAGEISERFRKDFERPSKEDTNRRVDLANYIFDFIE